MLAIAPTSACAPASGRATDEGIGTAEPSPTSLDATSSATSQGSDGDGVDSTAEPPIGDVGIDPPGTTSGGGGDPMHGDPAADFAEFWALLDEIEGWATGTTGGIAGTVFVVDTLADDGERSLRAALESPDAHWIVFSPGLGGTIELASTITPASDKTVDARGHAIQIRSNPADRFTAVKIEGQSNLVFVGLLFDDELENWDQDTEGADGINLTNSHHVWIHRCSFARWLDGAIDIRHDAAAPGELPHHISVTWSSFSRVYQALNWTADLASFGHNSCDRVRRRCIQMIAGRGHSYDNVIADWNSSAIQNSKDGAELLSQLNMFVPGGVADVNSRVGGGTIRIVDNHAFGNVDFLGGSDAIDEDFVAQSQELARIDECDANDDACWNELRALVESEAGIP